MEERFGSVLQQEEKVKPATERQRNEEDARKEAKVQPVAGRLWLWEGQEFL